MVAPGGSAARAWRPRRTAPSGLVGRRPSSGPTRALARSTRALEQPTRALAGSTRALRRRCALRPTPRFARPGRSQPAARATHTSRRRRAGGDVRRARPRRRRPARPGSLPVRPTTPHTASAGPEQSAAQLARTRGVAAHRTERLPSPQPGRRVQRRGSDLPRRIRHRELDAGRVVCAPASPTRALAHLTRALTPAARRPRCP